MLKHRLLKAIKKEPIDRTPVWLMRQAGRYLPEYRQIREKAGSFLTLCKTPELAAEVTLQPLARFPLDAAILFSDILTIPDAMGLGLAMTPQEGPTFLHPVRTEVAIQQLQVPDPNDLRYVYDTIALLKPALANRCPLIGFTGSPFTLAVYMVEGRGKNGFPKALFMLKKNPTLLHHLLTTLTQAVIMHLSEQIKAGVDLVMIFDTWGGLLSTDEYDIFSLAYLKTIITTLHNMHAEVPIILFTKDGGAWIEKMAATGCDVIGIDHNVSLHDARQRVGSQVTLQGNLNPATLLESESVIEATVKAALASFGRGEGHIFNLSHGVTPDVPPEHVSCLIHAVHELSAPYHQSPP